MSEATSGATEHLPVDMRPKRSGGIGSGAKENKQAAAAHDQAVSAKSGSPDEEGQAEAEEAEKKAKPALTKCPSCESPVNDEQNFCGRCGRDLLEDPEEILGISFKPEDLDEYLFKGHLTKTIILVGRELVLRSSMANDHREISDYLISDWNDKGVTNDFWENIRQTTAISLAIVSFDGSAIGQTVEERVEWMLGRGSAFVDMVTTRVVLFNKAITNWLNKKNTFLAS